MSFTYEWRRDGTPIGTGNTHVVVALDVGTNITCAVTATNALGSTTAVTDPVSIGGPTTGTGAFFAQRSAVIATGTVAGGLVTGTGAIAARASDVDGTGSVTGALGVTGIGLLAAQSSDVDASGSVTGAGVGLLIAQASDVDGVGAVRSTGTGVLTAQASDADGIGLVTGAGIGTLVAQQADVDGVGTAAFTATTTVTAPNGQWWKFNGTLTNGTYINGDPWVLDSGGGVSLIEVSFMPTGTGQEARNGGMINPTFNTMVESATASPLDVTTALRQGYDGRIDESAVRTNWIYDAAYNAHATLPKTLHAGDSLVSVRSQNFPPPVIEGPSTQTFAEFWAVGGTNKVALSRMAVVTVVGSAPFADSFRPNYFGTTKINKRFSDCNLALLPDLTAPYNPKSTAQEGFHIDLGSIYGAGPPDGNRTQAEMIHINSLRDAWYWIYPGATSNRSMVQAHYNQQWHTPVGTTLGQLAMYCMCDFADRDFFLKRLIQVAIDAYAVASSSTLYLVPFSSGAGYYPSPCWLIRLAGLLFNDTGMKNAKDISTNHVDYAGVAIKKWGEMNRVYLTPNATAHAQYLRVLGEDYTAGFPLYGDRPTADRSAGQSSNGTEKDPAGVYDMNDYRYGTPHPTYPIGYLNWAPLTGPNAGVEQTGTPYNSGDSPPFNAEPWLGSYRGGLLGTYMSNSSRAMMATVLSSIAMGDEAFWGGAVVPFAIRTANDVKMVEGYGYEFTDAGLGTYLKDVRQMGGTGNGWMTDMWNIVVGEPVEPPSDSFDIVTFDGASDYLTRGADLTTIANGTEFTFVIRCQPTDSASVKVFITDAAENLAIYRTAANFIQMQAWGAGLYLGFTSTVMTFDNADGMQTLFVSGRTTGTPIQHCYLGDTDMVPGGDPAAGTIDFTSTNWAIGATVAGAGKLAGDVAFVWFDTRYYDVSDPDVRALWDTPALLGVDGSGPGFEPKIYMTGTADVWNVGTNHALGGNFTMHGAVSGAAGDTTAPVLSSAVGTATGTTTAALQVSTNEGNGTLYWVVTYSATAPTAAQVKLGQTNTGAAAPDSGSQAVSGSGVQSVSGGATGLTAATACFAYFMHEDASTNQSNVATDGFTTDTVDTTAPVLSSPVATELSSTTASLTVTTDEANGTLYWVVTLSATPPTAAQIKLGQNHASAAAPDSGSQGVSSTGAQSISGGATGLSASTPYFAYFMHEDAVTNQSSVATDGFTTSAPASSFTTVTFGSGDGLTKSGAPAPDSTEFTLVVRCQVAASATARIFINDNAGWIDARISSTDLVQSTFWNASSISLGCSGSSISVENGDGMVTIYIAGRTTGTPILHCYVDGTSVGLTGLTQASGTIKFNVPNWNVLSPFLGDVQFFWFDTVYYDISNSGVRDDWLAANIGGNGEGPGAIPKIYFTGNAAAWNSGVNLGSGGNFTMSGAVV